jgi:hypothetical protein
MCLPQSAIVGIMKTTTTSARAQLQALLVTAHEEVIATRLAYDYAKTDANWDNYKESSRLLAQIVSLCGANGIEID